jgi:hypothetical protein
MQSQTDELAIEPNITEELFETKDPLALDIDDDSLVLITDKRIEDDKNWYKEKKDLYARQQRNKDFLFGRQIDEDELRTYDARYVDNLIYESESSIKPIALSRLPDLLVKPGEETDESNETAENMTDVINDDVRKRAHRKVLGLSFKHHPVYFVGIIKYLWDPEKGPHGDYKYKVIHPDNIVIGKTASDDPQDAPYIAEYITKTVKELIMMFPNKEEDLKEKLVKDGTIAEDKLNKEAGLATEVKLTEVWFTWYEKKEGKNQRIEGVLWKYEDLLLKKIKNPNWDWEGEDILFTLDEETNEKREVPEEQMQQAALFGMEIPGLESETVFSNHFETPRKPYIFITYDDWGEMPYDETSRIEQVIRLQEAVNLGGKQIRDMVTRTRGKHIFSTDSGLETKDVEKLDMANPDEDLLVEGKVNETHAFFQGEQPSAALFQEVEQNRERIFAKMGIHSTTRGEVEADTATGSQISREADFGRIDDLAEETINHAAEEMANAAMQMIKLRYTEDHLRRIVGKDGSVTFQKINRDLIEDGMEVTVHASGVDKILRKREAYERANLQLTDPLTFFEDTDAPDPKERTKRLFQYQSDPEGYYLEYVKDIEGTEGQAQALEEITQNQLFQGQPMGAPPETPATAGINEEIAANAGI